MGKRKIRQPRDKENLSLLTPHVNAIVERVLQKYVEAGLNANGSVIDVHFEAKVAYLRAQKVEYRRLWLSEHQSKAHDDLMERINELKAVIVLKKKKKKRQ
ncbi:MAG: hypothetical protein Q9170_003691 [Blastenia crenularia]